MELSDIVSKGYALAARIPSVLMKVPEFLVGVDLHREYQHHRNFCKEFITDSKLLAKRFEQSYKEEAKEIMLYRVGPLIFSASFIAMACLFEDKRFADLTLITGGFMLFGALKNPEYVNTERMLKSENLDSCLWLDNYGLVSEFYGQDYEGEEWKLRG